MMCSFMDHAVLCCCDGTAIASNYSLVDVILIFLKFLFLDLPV